MACAPGRSRKVVGLGGCGMNRAYPLVLAALYTMATAMLKGGVSGVVSFVARIKTNQGGVPLVLVMHMIQEACSGSNSGVSLEGLGPCLATM